MKNVISLIFFNNQMKLKDIAHVFPAVPTRKIILVQS